MRSLTILSLIQLLLGTLAVACLGASNDVDTAILAFPQLTAPKYQPEVAVRSANILIFQNPRCLARAMPLAKS
jgi:hypothetical protein